MPDIQKKSAPVGQSQAAEAEVFFTKGGLPDPGDIIPGENEEDFPPYFRMRSRYILNDRTLAAPRMARPGSDTIGFEFVRVGIPTGVMAVDWQSWRKGKRSEKPRPYTPTEDGNTVLLENQIDLDNLEIEGDDKPYFISAGTMYYAFRDRYAMTLSHPLPNYIDLPDKSIVVCQDSDFVPGILAAAWANNASRPAITKP